MPCGLYIHVTFTYSVGPSSIVRSELGPAPPFPPMRVLKVEWSWALSLVCEVALMARPHVQAMASPNLYKVANLKLWPPNVKHKPSPLILLKVTASNWSPQNLKNPFDHDDQLEMVTPSAKDNKRQTINYMTCWSQFRVGHFLVLVWRRLCQYTNLHVNDTLWGFEARIDNHGHEVVCKKFNMWIILFASTFQQ